MPWQCGWCGWVHSPRLTGFVGEVNLFYSWGAWSVLGSAAWPTGVSGTGSWSWWQLLCLRVSEHGDKGQAAAWGVRTWAPGVSAAPQRRLVLTLTPHGMAGSSAWEKKGMSFFRFARSWQPAWLGESWCDDTHTCPTVSDGSTCLLHHQPDTSLRTRGPSFLSSFFSLNGLFRLGLSQPSWWHTGHLTPNH